MGVFIDNEPVDLDGSELGSLLASAGDQLKPTGRVIVEVQVDGRPVVGDALEQHRHDPVQGMDIHLTSANPVEVAVTALTHARAQLDLATQAQQQTADLLQQDQPRQAMARLAEAIGVWQQTEQAVRQSTMLLNLSFDDKLIDDLPVGAVLDRVVEPLTELRDLVAAGDTLSLADALAYEWPQTAQQWGRLIDAMIQWAKEGSDPRQHHPHPATESPHAQTQS